MKKLIKRMFYALLFLVVTLVVTTVLLVNHYPAFGGKPEGKSLERIRSSPHHTGKKFTNLNPTKETFGPSDYAVLFSKIRKGNTNRTPKMPLPFKKWSKREIDLLPDTSTTVIWLGHSTFLIKMGGQVLLLDPMFGERPSPLPLFVKKRFNDELPIDIEDLSHIDVVIISHDHYDHLDYGSIRQLKDKTSHFLVPLGVGGHLRAWEIPDHKITELDWYEKVQIKSLMFISTPAQHFSGRSITDKMRTLWCSWVIQGVDEKIFFSGDSGYFSGFKEIGKRFGPFDLCLLECGQYDELWHDIHMVPEETAQAHLDLKGKVLVPIHWGTFSLSMHDWNDPVTRLSKKSRKLNLTLATPKIGEPLIIGNQFENEVWWNLEYEAL